MSGEGKTIGPTRYEIRVWIWDAHGHQRRYEDPVYEHHFDDVDVAVSQATLRSFLANIAIIEVFDNLKQKVVKVFVKGRGHR